MKVPGAKVVGIKAQVPKMLNGHVAACATGTAQEDGKMLGKAFEGQGGQEVQWKMGTAWYVPLVIFLQGPDIHDNTATI